MWSLWGRLGVTSVYISNTVNEMNPVCSLTQLYLGAAGGGISKAKAQCCWISVLCGVSVCHPETIIWAHAWAPHFSRERGCSLQLPGEMPSPCCSISWMWFENSTDSSETSCIPADFTAWIIWISLLLLVTIFGGFLIIQLFHTSESLRKKFIWPTCRIHTL